MAEPSDRQSSTNAGRVTAGGGPAGMVLGLLVVAFAAPLAAQEKAPPRVVRYQATLDGVKYVYGVAPPVARLAPGDILETNTLDCFGGVLRKPGDTLALVKGDNPLTGPFHVEGAEPGDTLVVKFLEVKLDSDQGVGAFAPGFGALTATFYTPMLNPPIPERIYFYPVDRARQVGTFRAQDSGFTTEIPLHPFLGCVGVAPPGGEARMSVTPGEWGGNMDTPEASAGHTLYLPVNVPGALLYLGDGHAVQGDGEVAGTGLEIAMKVRLQVGLVKGQAIRWPRFEDDEYLMALGAYRPLDDALRIAFTELVGWLRTDYGLSDLDAYELLSKVAVIRLSEMVDPNYVVVAKVPKKHLPPRK
jgi:acetamidase/formamidase